jgi:PhzF family phenazine biosynthesis protein
LTAHHAGELIEMDFPAKVAERCEPADGLIEALGAHPVGVARNEFDYLVEMASEDDVRALSPDFAMLRRIPVRGVIVTSRASTKAFDFVSRFFAPGSGVDEDPVTGSAHCALAPYWAPRLGKNDFVAYQASPRGGVLHVTLVGNRVRLAGRAVTVLRGDLAV